MFKKTFLAFATASLACAVGGASAQSVDPSADDDEICDVIALDQPCSPAAYRALDMELDALYRRHLALLRDSLDETRLRDAQGAWARFVEADCLFDIGSAEPPEDYSTAGRRCRAAHLMHRIERLKRLLYCLSPECEAELALPPLPQASNTLLLGRPSVLTSGGGVLRRRPTGAYVPFNDGDTVEPGDLLLFRSGGGFRLNNKTFGGKEQPYWLRVQ